MPLELKTYNKAHSGIIELITSVTLGTNGACYKHLDTTKRLNEVDSTEFITVERNFTTYANITACQRGKTKYLRYFAFKQAFQSKGKSKNSQKTNRTVDTIKHYLGKNEQTGYYAYIDPSNSKSLQLSERFGFKQMAEIKTQTFSRFSPRLNPHVTPTMPSYHYHQRSLYYTHKTPNTRYYAYTKNGQRIGYCAVKTIQWKIEHLGGTAGLISAKLLPYIPILNTVFNPKRFTFLAVEYIQLNRDHDDKLKPFLEGILHLEKQNAAIWWVDAQDPLYQNQNNKGWGLLHKFSGTNDAALVGKNIEIQRPVFVNGFDFV